MNADHNSDEKDPVSDPSLFRSLGISCGLASTLIGILGLAGLFFGIPLLTSIVPGLKPIAVSACIIWIILGLVLACFAYRPMTGVVWYTALAGVFVITAASAIELPLNILGQHLFIESFLISLGESVFPETPTPISPLAAILALTSSIALFLLLVDSHMPQYERVVRNAAGILGTFVAAFSLTILISYVYGHPFLYGTVLIPIAAISALAGLFIGVGIIAQAGRVFVPLSYLIGPSVRARLLRMFLPLVIIIIFVQNYLDSLIPTYLGWQNTILSALLLVLFTTIVIYFISKTAGVFGRSLESEQEKRRQAEITERETRKYLESLIHHANAPIITWSPDYRITEFNQAFETLTGLSREMVIGQHLHILFPEETCKSSMARIRSTASGEQWTVVEIPIRNTGGATKTVLWNSANITGPDGAVIATIAQGTDISDRKLAEEKLFRVNERFLLATRAAHLGVWDWDIRKNKLVWDSQMYRLYGISENTFTGAFDAWINGIHPDDKEKARATTEQALSGEREYDTEFRAVWPDGTVRIIKAYGEVIRDAAGTPIRMTGINFDITATRQAEASVRQSESRFRSVFENSMLGVVLVRPDFTFQAANAMFCSMLGYTEEELKERTFASITHPDHVATDIEHVSRLKSGELAVYKTEKRYIRKDGTVFWASVTISTLNDPDGRLVHFLGFIEDITPRKQSEEALAESERKYRSLYRFAQVGLFETSFENATVIACNQLYADLAGFKSVEDAIGKDILHLYVHPEDRTEVGRILREKGFIENHTVQLRNESTGRIFWGQFSARFNYERNIAEGSIIDITEQKEAESKIQNARNFLDSIIEQSPNPIWIADAKGTLVRLNNACCNLLHITPDEVVGKYNIFQDSIVESQGKMPLVRSVFDEGRAVNFDIEYDTELLSSPALHESAKVYLNVTIFPIRDVSGRITNAVIQHLDFTERRKAEESRREAETRLSMALDVGNAGVWEWNVETNEVRFDPGFHLLLGYSPGELPTTLQEWMSYHNQEDVPVWMGKAEAYLKGETPLYESEHRIRAKDGSWAWVFTRGQFIDSLSKGPRTLFVGIAMNITESKRAAAAVRESEEKYRGLFNRMTEGSALHEMEYDEGGNPVDYRILEVNPAFESVLGIRKEDVIGKTSREAYGVDAPPYLDIYARVIENGKAELFETFFAPIEKHFSISAYSTRERRFATIFEDITERKKAELLREKLIRELEEKNAELERFNYTVSHDLKSPLITIKGFAGLLEDDAHKSDPVQLKKDIQRIIRAADIMQQLLSDVLELSRIGKIVSVPRRVSFSRIAQEAVEILAGPLAEKAISVEIAPNLPYVNVDHERIREVLVNLIENAIKYAGNQPDPVIRIGVDQSGDVPVFFVQDSGIGIDPRYLERIFNLFEKLDPSYPGTGVGLTIVRRIIEVHGGKIWAESEGEGKGATFRFTLPAA